MIRRGFGALAGVAIALCLAACSAPPASTPPVVQQTDAQIAAARLAAGDHASAAEHYRRALASAPDAVDLHYGLAVASSYLDETAAAIREFRWVLRHGKPGQPEVVAARDWLIKARVIAPQERSDTRRASGDEAEPSAAATARVEGRVVSGSAGEPQPAKRQQLFLIDHPNRERRYPGRTDDEGRYVFPAVVPGIYKLTDRVVGDPAWRLRVEAKPGQVVFQDLGPSNTTKSRDDFPTQ